MQTILLSLVIFQFALLASLFWGVRKGFQKVSAGFNVERERLDGAIQFLISNNGYDPEGRPKSQDSAMTHMQILEFPTTVSLSDQFGG